MYWLRIMLTRVEVEIMVEWETGGKDNRRGLAPVIVMFLKIK